MLKSASSKFSVRSLFSRKKKYPVPKKDVDLQVLDDFTLNVNSLIKITPTTTHPLHKISTEGRKMIDRQPSRQINLKLDDLDKYIGEQFNGMQKYFEEPETVALADKPQVETAIRLHLSQTYFRRLKKAIDDKELQPDFVNTAVLRNLFDVMLRGTASERIEHHLEMYGPELNQERLQECFYALYGPEVHTCTKLFLLNPALHPHHKKNLPKFAKTYLLDKHELNVKLRCLLAWSDPNYSGFNTLADDLKLSAPDVLRSRRAHYETGTEVGLQFMRDYIGSRNEFYNNKEENRTTMKRGAAFFVATCLLDWAVCVL
eukprot:gene16454-18777_t